MRKGRREIELGREGVEDDRRRLQSKEARLAELAADSQEKHQTITLYVPSCMYQSSLHSLLSSTCVTSPLHPFGADSKKRF